MPSIGPYAAGEVLGRLDSTIGFSLGQLGEDYFRRSSEVLAGHGLRPRQLRTLDLLADRGATSQRDLAELLAIDRSILVSMLNPLEVEKLVKRERDCDDRRRHIVTITPAGEARLDAAGQALQELEEGFLAPLTKEQRVRLRALLLALRGNGEELTVDEC